MKSLVLPLALLLASASSVAEPRTVKPITITQAYSHPTAAPGVPGVGFFTLTNTGKKADRLLAVTSPLAGRVEIHHSTVKNGVMQMRALPRGVALPPGKTVAFAAGGLHLMLFALQAPLVEGGRVPVTFRFERAGSVEGALQVEPRQPVEAAPAEAHHAHH